MNMNWAALLELGLVFGSVLGLAVWELWRLRRDRKQPHDRAEDEPKP